jgi:hypothetical protein
VVLLPVVGPLVGVSGDEVFLDVEGVAKAVAAAVERKAQRFDKWAAQSGFRGWLLPLKDCEQFAAAAAGRCVVVFHDIND